MYFSNNNFLVLWGFGKVCTEVDEIGWIQRQDYTLSSTVFTHLQWLEISVLSSHSFFFHDSEQVYIKNAYGFYAYFFRKASLY